MTWILKLFLAVTGSLMLMPSNPIKETPQVISSQTQQTTQDPNNPLNYAITIKWYWYDSIANKISNYWYNNLWPWAAEAMILTMYWESWIDPSRVAKNWDSWVCQWSHIRHSKFIHSAWFSDPMVQAKECLSKRVAIKYDSKRANYWKAFGKRNKYKDVIIYMNKQR